MSESALEKLKWEAKEKELEKKTEVFRQEQVERESVEHVKLIGAIYVEPLASHAPTIDKTNFWARKKSRELEVAFNFLWRTTTSIETLTPQVIIISKEEEEVEILSQLIVDKQLEQAPKPKPVEEEEL